MTDKDEAQITTDSDEGYDAQSGQWTGQQTTPTTEAPTDEADEEVSEVVDEEEG